MRRREIASVIFALAAFPVDYLVYTLLPSISTVVVLLVTIVMLAIATFLWFTGKPVLDLKSESISSPQPEDRYRIEGRRGYETSQP